MENSEEVDLVRVCWTFCSLVPSSGGHITNSSIETNLYTVTRYNVVVCQGVTCNCLLSLLTDVTTEQCYSLFLQCQAEW